MSDTAKSRVGNHTPGNESLDIRVELESLLKSPPFHSSRQCQTLLRYLVENSLNGQEGMLKERVIGAEVFGRNPDYNTGDDPIVRARVGELRKRLAQYYQSKESDGSNLQIVIPPGSYQVRLQYHTPEVVVVPPEAAQSLQEEESAKEQAKPVSADPGLERRIRKRNIWVGAAGLTLFILGALAGALLGHQSPDSNKQAVAVSNPLVRRMFVSGSVVNVVTGDSALASVLATFDADISADNYIHPDFMGSVLSKTQDLALRTALSTIYAHPYTTLYDADVTAQCSKWGSMLGAKTYVRFARYMHVRDFQQGNFVIIGNRRFNPWVSLFEPKLNFVMEEDPATHMLRFKNRNPKPGESKSYKIHNDGPGVVGYVDIAVLPNLSGSGTVLLLDGLFSEMNGAATNFIFAKDLPPSVFHVLESEPDGSTTEILLQVRDVESAQSESDIVSIHNSQ